MVFERIISIHLREPSAQCASLQRGGTCNEEAHAACSSIWNRAPFIGPPGRARTTRALLAATCFCPHHPSFKDNLTRIYTDFGTSFLPPHFPFGHAPASTASDGTQARGEIDSTMNWRIGGVPLEATPPLA